MNLKQFKFWLYELDEQEFCNSREKIVEFVTNILEEQKEKIIKAVEKKLKLKNQGFPNMSKEVTDVIRSIN